MRLARTVFVLFAFSYLRNLEPLVRLGRPASDVIFTYWVLSGSWADPASEDCEALLSRCYGRRFATSLNGTVTM